MNSEQPVFMDVWSRSGSKYRARAVALLAVNVLLFAGLGAFAYWLRSGEFLAFGQEGYWDELSFTFRGVGRPEVSLGSLLVGPISVQSVPMLIPIIGLLMAALISIPILVAILYKFWSSLPFIAVVGFVAVMPWLAITLLGSCVLASIRPFRTRYRFVSALIGLVPAIVYLVFAWKGTHDVVVGRIEPVDSIKFVAPWVLAVVASAFGFAVVLATARIVDYRPGAVMPILALMFGLPIGLFEKHVGRDELYYRLLEAADAQFFSDVDASLDWERAARKAWEQHPLPRPSLQAVKEITEQKWLVELASDITPYQNELSRHQLEISERCDWFHRQFPASRYTPSALFIKARAWDRRVDLIEFRRHKWIRFYDGFPSEKSRDSWKRLLENCPDSVLGAVARLRLAQLEARGGDVDRAITKLANLLARFDTSRPTPDLDSKEGGTASLAVVLAPEAPEASLDIPMHRILVEAHRLYDLLLSNRDPLYGYDPISGPHSRGEKFTFGLLDLNPRDANYAARLRELLDEYPRCQITDNVELEIAKTEPNAKKRAIALKMLLDRHPKGDAVPEALLRLGVALKEAGEPVESNDVLAKLVREHVGTIWARQATDFDPMIGRSKLASTP